MFLIFKVARLIVVNINNCSWLFYFHKVLILRMHMSSPWLNGRTRPVCEQRTSFMSKHWHVVCKALIDCRLPLIDILSHPIRMLTLTLWMLESVVDFPSVEIYLVVDSLLKIQSTAISILWVGSCASELQLKVNCRKKFGLVWQLLAESHSVYNSLSAAIEL